MATTQIADVIVPDVFNPYVVERTAELAAFYMGGIVSNDPQLNALAAQGGKLINMPFWSDLTGADEVLSDSGALTPTKISAAQDVAVLNMRGRAWSVNDLAKALSGDDPMARIGDLVADYWARRFQAVGLQSLVGVFLDNVANDSGDMSVDVSGTLNSDVAAATRLSGDVFVDGQATFGDALRRVEGIAVHSAVYANMKKNDNISFERESLGTAEIETYRGIRIIVDDSLPFTPAGGASAGDSAPSYTSYLFGSGALGMGQGSAPMPTETDRDSLAGDDILITRNHFVMHPRGVAFQSASVADAAPTNAELAIPSNWSRVYERKNVRMAQIITNG
ncbi:MAG TPA: coat protein [Methylococcaceae bacterium]|jgi:hypothetical protein|nr:coat protein [Methylococcaceae bacterium]